MNHIPDAHDHDQEQENPLEDQYFPFQRIVRETEKAVLFDDGQGRFWLPKSCLSYPEATVVRVPHWLDVKYTGEKPA